MEASLLQAVKLSSSPAGERSQQRTRPRTSSQSGSTKETGLSTQGQGPGCETWALDTWNKNIRVDPSKNVWHIPVGEQECSLLGFWHKAMSPLVENYAPLEIQLLAC